MIFNIEKVDINCTINQTTPDGAAFLQALVNLGDMIMTTKQDILDAIANESAEVTARLDALAAEIVVLQTNISNGVAVTEADLAEIMAGVQGIYTPAEPVVA